MARPQPGVVSASAQGATVEPVLELLAVLRFPGLDGEAVLLLDLVAIPLWDALKRTEGDDAKVWRQVVDVAALEAFLVLVILKTRTSVGGVIDYGGTQLHLWISGYLCVFQSALLATLKVC
jgi:hypothetical protein